MHELLLGEDDFYVDVFRSLGVPYEPVRWRKDINPIDREQVLLEKQTQVNTLINTYRVRGHLIADLGQYRLARSYFDQMPTVERDQAITAKAQAEFEKLLRQYPESRYAPDSLVKIEACRLRLAQKEVWIAEFYVRQGKLEAAVQRYDAVLRDYSRTAVAPQALFQKADALRRLGRSDEAANVLQRLVDDYPTSDWSRRAQEQIPRLTSRSGS